MSSVKEISECPVDVKKLVCIQYPGIVSSVDNMLRTLGGINIINEVHNNSNRRLELRFRPGDIFCKPTCGERHNTTGLLVKITKKKKKQQYMKPGDETLISSALIGVIHTKYLFENLCDYQYLPFIKKQDSKDYERLSDVIPRSITSSKWLDEESPLFLPPALFTRMDIPQDYFFRNDVAEKNVNTKSGTLYRTRKMRKHHALIINFNDKDVPAKPSPLALKQIRGKRLNAALCLQLKNIFSDRPVWSKNALTEKYGFSSVSLGLGLQCVAYYFRTGPWGKLWIRLGYDPRLDSTSWIYQVFDFRLRQSGGAKAQVKAKRKTTEFLLPYKNVNHSKRKKAVAQPLNSTVCEGDTSSCETDNRSSLYIFKKDTIPPYRQMFYQYCDVDVPEVQKILEDSILSLSKPVCNEKMGWLPLGIDVKCRNAVTKLVEKSLLDKCVDPSFIDDNISNEDSDDIDE